MIIKTPGTLNLTMHPWNYQQVDIEECLSSFIEIQNIAKEVCSKLFERRNFSQTQNKKIFNTISNFCHLVKDYQHPYLLSQMINSSDPWLWIVGNAFSGIDIEVELQTLDQLTSGHIRRSEAVSRSDLLSRLFELVHSPDFERLKDSARRNLAAVTRSLLDYMMNLTVIYPKLMVIRLDLSYSKVYTSEMRPHTRILADWGALRAYLEVNFASSHIGYAIKLEYAVDKCIHMHALLFFNGAVVRQDTSIARHLGEHWKQDITQGAGIYFNCNTQQYKQRLKHCCLGVFTKGNVDFIRGLEEVARYFSKKDAVVRIAMPEVVHTLRRTSLSVKEKQMLQKKLLTGATPAAFGPLTHI